MSRKVIDESWDRVDGESWVTFAASWLHELRTGESPDDRDYGQTVVLMNSTARPELQWKFILAAVVQADSDDELGHVAAGPLEHLLGYHGEQYIGVVEAMATKHTKFARMLTGARKYMMSDEVWNRMRAIQTDVAEPLVLESEPEVPTVFVHFHKSMEPVVRQWLNENAIGDEEGPNASVYSVLPRMFDDWDLARSCRLRPSPEAPIIFVEMDVAGDGGRRNAHEKTLALVGTVREAGASNADTSGPWRVEQR